MTTFFLHISSFTLLQIVLSEIIPAAICAIIAIAIYFFARAKNKKFLTETLALQAELIKYKEICENAKLEKETAQKEVESALKEKKTIAEENKPPHQNFYEWRNSHSGITCTA